MFHKVPNINHRVLISAPAKINLTLNVYGKLPDGYHQLSSILSPISLKDTLEIIQTSGQGIYSLQTTLDPKLSRHIRAYSSEEEILKTLDSEDNLVLKACRMYFLGKNPPEKQNFDVQIKLFKRIPIGAGLGGGSSDAAAILLALNSINKFYTFSELLDIAKQIGADVSGILYGKLILVQGRGEQCFELQNTVDSFTIQALRQSGLIIIKPPFPVSTPWAYQQLKKDFGELNEEELRILGENQLRNLGLTRVATDTTELTSFAKACRSTVQKKREKKSETAQKLYKFFCNDFHSVVGKHYSFYNEFEIFLSDSLSGGASQLGETRLLLSGSGSSLLLFLPNSKGLGNLCRTITNKYPECFVQSYALLPG